MTVPPQERPGERKLWLTASMGRLLQEAEATPDPIWLQEMDRETQHWLARMRSISLYQDIAAGRFDRKEMGRLHQQLGAAVVFPFPYYLGVMRQRVPVDSPVAIFTEANEREEQLHGVWWRRQSKHLSDLADEALDPRNIVLTEPAQAMRDHLTRASSEASIAEAIASVNYATETDAAVLTGEIFPMLIKIVPELSGPDGTWLKLHAAKDYKHAKIARLCLIEEVRDDADMQSRVAQAARTTHQLSYNLYADSYRAA